ncbi:MULTISPECIES: tRNA adenosine(34) deaminase TadA [unclassified Marinobacterium]|uniref:tRNA adenosine(34) deaminase TadA n=1 Tax=unclassified Marinobacterium TaxID=2644139 RepID=UPI001A06816D|nr:tRNA-specific adenosine deaminase [Marinobacterium sp. xm-a-152]NRP37020.1 tRNA-specific adenosine deaminase [Marinobacterium sp. xm-d-579]NRP47167.1 tRNA-specific adenosine deaminase [Marinobacterium sp. xm-d-543]NRP53335.1 tRNA-specific adenosine deaminase [Marinobacterium sp. xm-v-242]NRP60021.1 tRNA-specific adenosine deaminase [Marinobacterium sp. xm-d-564]NRP78120.1 tRNA-specific adenosine deaminase [Marinobacterium sp. xm-m-383]NRP95310.1 tRNA-specific adenosine deaminase [Marinobac
MDDQYWMRQALELAAQAGEHNEVPVGAIVVLDDQVIGRGFNRPISGCDPSAHAEIQALRDAANRLENYRLVDATLYVTIEPCSMCAGAIVHSRIKRLVFGALEPKAGVATSQAQFFVQPWLNHRVEVQGGLLADECSSMISDFFARRRDEKRQARLNKFGEASNPEV